MRIDISGCGADIWFGLRLKLLEIMRFGIQVFLGFGGLRVLGFRV